MDKKLLKESPLESKIPIKIYDSDFDMRLSEEKKQEILDIFSKSNYICSEKEYNEIKDKLYLLIRQGDAELIKILLGKTIEDEAKDMSFKIDKVNKTASLTSTTILIKSLFHEALNMNQQIT